MQEYSVHPLAISLRVGLQTLVLVGVLTLPIGYVLAIGVVGIIGFGMYEIVLGGVLFDAAHAALFTSMPLGDFPVTALFLVCVSLAVLARRTISHTYFLKSS